MITKEYNLNGNENNPVILLIHGGGLSDWMWRPQVEALQNDYRIITVILDGHGEAQETTFDSIEKSAQQIIDYIREKLGGKVFAICGLSIGAQVLVEILSRQQSITQKAIVESAMVIPMKHGTNLLKLLTVLSYPLAKIKWFAKLQAKQMYIPSDMFERYFADSSKISRKSLCNMIVSNARYSLPDSFVHTRADVLAMCGEKEYAAMKKSTITVHQTALKGQLLMVPDCGHGVSIKYPEKYVEILKEFFAR